MNLETILSNFGVSAHPDSHNVSDPVTVADIERLIDAIKKLLPQTIKQ